MTTKCAGLNCRFPEENHSPECIAEHAASAAGGRFVPSALAVDAGARDEREAHGIYEWAGEELDKVVWGTSGLGPVVRDIVRRALSKMEVVSANRGCISESLTDEQLAIIERALHHEFSALSAQCCAAAQKSFRLPSGRAVTSEELKDGFKMRDDCKATLYAVHALRASSATASDKEQQS